MALVTLVAFHKNGEIKLDTSVTSDFKAGAPLGQKSDGSGYSLYKAGESGKSYVGPSLNDRKDENGHDYIPSVVETPAILELVEGTAGDLIAVGVTFKANDVVYVDENGKYTNIQAGTPLVVEVGVCRQASPLVIKFTK